MLCMPCKAYTIACESCSIMQLGSHKKGLPNLIRSIKVQLAVSESDSIAYQAIYIDQISLTQVGGGWA